MNSLPVTISVSAVSIAGTVVSIVVVTVISISTVVISRALGSTAIINQVDITEIPVVVLATIAVASIGRVAARVAGTGGTGLHIAVAIGAEDKGIVITEVETIIATLAGVAAILGVGGRGSSHEGEDDEDLHVYSWN